MGFLLFNCFTPKAMGKDLQVLNLGVATQYNALKVVAFNGDYPNFVSLFELFETLLTKQGMGTELVIKEFQQEAKRGLGLGQGQVKIMLYLKSKEQNLTSIGEKELNVDSDEGIVQRERNQIFEDEDQSYLYLGAEDLLGEDRLEEARNNELLEDSNLLKISLNLDNSDRIPARKLKKEKL